MTLGLLTTLLCISDDTFLAEELAREDTIQIANLTSAQTGVPGTIFISTAMGAHGSRVKYFLQPGRTQPSFSVSVTDTLRSVPTACRRAQFGRCRLRSSPGSRATRMSSWTFGIAATRGQSPK